MNLEISLIDERKWPFHYALFETVFPDHVHASILRWLEATQFWKVARTDFYEQFEFCLDHVVVPQRVRFLVESSFKSELRVMMETILETKLSPRIRVLAHMLVPGQHIAIHNDMNAFGESHRLTVQINSGLKESDGGYFLLFGSADVSDVHRILKPISNSAIAFAISPDSYHAVTSQHRGRRFTLVFSFSMLDGEAA